jgi:hypothetical protein
LLQRAATGLSDALDVVLDLNPRATAAAELKITGEMQKYVTFAMEKIARTLSNMMV